MKNVLLTLAAGGLLQAAELLPIANMDFEQQFEGWKNFNAMAVVEKEAAHSGTYGLHITDTKENDGSNLFAPSFAVTPGKGYRLTYWARKNEIGSSGTHVYIRFYDAAGQMMHLRPETLLAMKPSRRWKQHVLNFKAPEGAATACVWIHSTSGSLSNDYLDDFAVYALSAEETVVVEEPPRRGFTRPEPQRVAEIAAMLPEMPRGLGYPVDRRDKWDALPHRKGVAGLIAKAEGYLPKPPPELKDDEYLLYTTTGDRDIYQKPYFERKDRLHTFAVAEAVENRGRFLPALEREIAAILADKSWVLPAHDTQLTNFRQTQFTVDLFSSERASDLATIDWWFGPHLKEETRAGIRYEIQRRVLDPYLYSVRTGDMLGRHWWMACMNNWNAVCSCNMVHCALTIVPDRQVRAEILAAAEVSRDFFFDGFTPDGYCSEGIGYWNYGFGHYMMMAETVFEMTGGKMDLFKHPRIEAVAAFARNIQVENGLGPAFADCGVNARPTQVNLTLIQRHWPQCLVCRANVEEPLRAGLPMMTYVSFEPEKSGAGLPETAVYPLRSEFPQAGIYVLRSRDDQWRTFGTVIKGGHNDENHNHNDVGSMLITWNGKKFVIDPGAETYARQTASGARYTFELLSSFGHSVPVVGGECQQAGRESCGKFTKTEFSDERDTLELDLADAYDVEGLKALTRTVVFDRKARQVTIRDAVAFEQPKAFETALTLGCELKEMGKERCLLVNGKERMELEISVDGADWKTSTRRIVRMHNRQGPPRLAITLDKPVTSATITMTLRPLEAAK